MITIVFSGSFSTISSLHSLEHFCARSEIFKRLYLLADSCHPHIASTSFVTTEPGLPGHSPIETPGSMIAPIPIKAPLPIFTFSTFFPPKISLRTGVGLKWAMIFTSRVIQTSSSISIASGYRVYDNMVCNKNIPNILYLNPPGPVKNAVRKDG